MTIAKGINRIKVFLLIISLLVASISLVACSNTKDELTGRWNMVGLSKSYTEFKAGGKYEIVMYSSELTGGMEEMYDELGVDLPETSEQKGKYTLDGDTITLTDSENEEMIVTMALDGDRILSENEVVLIREEALN